MRRVSFREQGFTLDRDGCHTHVGVNGLWSVSCGFLPGRGFLRTRAGFADSATDARAAARAAKTELLRLAEEHRQRNLAAFERNKARRQT